MQQQQQYIQEKTFTAKAQRPTKEGWLTGRREEKEN